MPLDVSRVRALCFDVDGTLRDTDDQYVDQLTRWLKPLQFLFAGRDPRKIARRIVMATESPAAAFYSLPDRLGIDNHLSAVVQLANHLGFTRRSDTFWIVLNVFEAMKALSTRYPMAVISARNERATLAFLQQFGLHPFFQCVATARTCAHTKPYPDPILWAAQRMGVPADACLMVGDMAVDIRAGRAAGAQTVGVLCGFGGAIELRNAGADHIVNSPCDLPPLLPLHPPVDDHHADDDEEGRDGK